MKEIASFLTMQLNVYNCLIRLEKNKDASLPN